MYHMFVLDNMQAYDCFGHTHRCPNVIEAGDVTVAGLAVVIFLSCSAGHRRQSTPYHRRISSRSRSHSRSTGHEVMILRGGYIIHYRYTFRTVVANHQSNEAHTSQRERKIHANDIPLQSRDDAVTRHLGQSILSDVESWWHGSHELCWWRAKVLHLRGTVNTASREMKATRTSFMSVTILTP